MNKETKEEVVNKILENAENCPWKIKSAMIGKLPMVYMRQRGLTYDQAMEITLGIVSNIGNLDDDEKIDKIKAMLLTRIDLGE
jgi:hypothetical protein